MKKIDETMMRKVPGPFPALVVALALTSTCLPGLSLALTGEHVCHRVENYTVTAREQYTEPVEILTLAWCLQIPPRCPQTRTEMRTRWRMKTEVKYKSVPVCCEGYVTQELVGNGSGDAKCVPYCKKCRSGVCTAPNECTCDPGFQGQDCAFECPQGTWGQDCGKECNCLREVSCNPVSGKCECPAGWTGARCENKCPEGQWGAGCNSVCLCEGPCHHESGECIEPPAAAGNGVIGGGGGGGGGGGNNAPIDAFEASGNLVPAKTPNSDYIDVIDFDREAVLPRVTEHEPETSVAAVAVPGLLGGGGGELLVLQASGPRMSTEGLSTKAIEDRPVTRQQLPAAATSALLPARPSTTEGNQLSQPDSGSSSSSSPKRSSFDFDERRSNFRVIVSPKTDYVKTTRKGELGSSESISSSSSSMSIPIDVAAMIVVGALVSIGLTSVAALMIFHIRSRLLKAALSIYNQEKVERQYCAAADKDDDVPGKGLDVTIGTLPRTMTRVNPMYSAASDAGSAVLTFDERPVEYANGTVTIGIRLSSNLRDLLESHYDKPASCSQHQQQQQQQQQQRSGSAATMAAGPEEHVYAEIPHAAPYYFGKYT